MTQILVLAAGKGTRMNSELPKVMHEINGMPMLWMVLQNAGKISEDISIIYSEDLLPYLPHEYKHVFQKERLGTGHALYCALPWLNDSSKTLVLYGDNPFISPDLMKGLLDCLDKEDASVASIAFTANDPAGYGRVVMDDEGNFLKIVECKDATEEEKKITLCNSGIMAFAPSEVQQILPIIMEKGRRVNGEYYLTDAISVARSLGKKVAFITAERPEKVIGVNTQAELMRAREIAGQSMDDDR